MTKYECSMGFRLEMYWIAIFKIQPEPDI